MKILHLADLHIGKNIAGYSMLEEQKKALRQILDIVDDQQIRTILIAGDIYDKKIVPKEALLLYNEFLVELVIKRHCQVMAISGNHDSKERLEAGNLLTEGVGYYVEGILKKQIKCVTLEDEFGPIDFYLIPFADISEMRIVLENPDIHSFDDGIRHLVKKLPIKFDRRNVALIHCYLVSSMDFVPDEQIESQKPLTIGGKEYVESDIFEAFDYVAVGHLHRSQKVKLDNIRYCGTFMKYSFSEEKHLKSVTIIDLKEKGNLVHSLFSIQTDKEFRTIHGYFDQIIKNSLQDQNREDYVQFLLEDENLVTDGMARLKKYYPNAMLLSYPKKLRSYESSGQIVHAQSKNPLEIFIDFYKFKTGQDPEKEDIEEIKSILATMGGSP